MLTRKVFITGTILTATAIITGCKSMGIKIKNNRVMKNGKIKTGLVIWYSQAGNTERIGRVIVSSWRKQGIKVTSGDYRNLDAEKISGYDIIAAGSPVFYYEVPENFRKWLKTIPSIEGIPVASFVTFGGAGGNQHNTACELLALLADKGGVPAGMKEFPNMSTFAPTWSAGNGGRVLKYRHLPDEGTFTTARSYAESVLSNAQAGKGIDVKGNFSLNNLIKGGTSIAFTKLVMTGHSIDDKKCIRCGKCSESCPVDAIGPDKASVDTDKCIACFGCVNNCPVNAVKIRFAGKDVYGYTEFLKRNNITIREPEV
ncbi:MAG TPA: EFR1 family ferrodoxin [Spirochaetota bacterium]|nr:EFR1 family ferrodoxin [Spirochaetota bacterium]